MNFKKMPELRRWTDAAIYCYSRGCVCTGCFYKEHLESECIMKQTVLALYTQLGKPNKRGRKMLKKQLSIIEHYGVEAQYKKLVEELDELKEAIVEKHSEAHIIEEMADVLNVMQGIIAKCEYEKDIKDMQEFKLERQIQRIYRENRKDKECAEGL
jgi:predicted house-cleaning noncanonical NTP pyrophosphatase (MazG superfamily)